MMWIENPGRQRPEVQEMYKLDLLTLSYPLQSHSFLPGKLISTVKLVITPC